MVWRVRVASAEAARVRALVAALTRDWAARPSFPFAGYAGSISSGGSDAPSCPGVGIQWSCGSSS